MSTRTFAIPKSESILQKENILEDLLEDLLKEIKTDDSVISEGEEIKEPLFRIRKPFEDTKLNLSDIEQICERILLLPFLQSKIYKSHKYMWGKQINHLAIGPSSAEDLRIDYIIELNFFPNAIILKSKTAIDSTLFSDILDILHGIKIEFNLEIDCKEMAKEGDQINKILSTFDDRTGFVFSCSTIAYNFESEIWSDLSRKERNKLRRMFRMMMRIDWRDMYFNGLVWDDESVLVMIMKLLVSVKGRLVYVI